MVGVRDAEEGVCCVEKGENDGHERSLRSIKVE